MVVAGSEVVADRDSEVVADGDSVVVLGAVEVTGAGVGGGVGLPIMVENARAVPGIGDPGTARAGARRALWTGVRRRSGATPAEAVGGWRLGFGGLDVEA